MKVFIVLCLVAAVAANFTDFQRDYHRKYKNAAEALEAEGHYNRHLKFFDEHNAKFEAGEVSFSVGVNQFADTNNAAFKSCMSVPPNFRRKRDVQPPSTFPAGAASKDWTWSMNPTVGTQGNCASCWAFSTVAQLESLYIRNFPNSDPRSFAFSQQYLVDCSRDTNNGCNGGWPATAMHTILATGMPLGHNYPYKAVQAPACVTHNAIFINPKIERQVNSYGLGEDGNEDQLKNIVSQDGPVAVGVFVTPAFQKYKSGIFYDPSYPGKCVVNHSMTVVGYGTENGHDYWLVRNSWGGNWGMKGYIKIARNRGNNCSVACVVMYMKTQ